MSTRALLKALPLVVAIACSSQEAQQPTPPTAEAGIDASVDAAPVFAPPYTLSPIERAHIGSNPDAADFHRTRATFEMPRGPFAEVKLIADLESTCFPFEQWETNPPPDGQHYPASCDAFDRNFDVALLDPAAPDTPSLALLHAITPFGGPMHVEVDVTDIFQVTRGSRQLEIEIPSYSDGEGKISGSNGGWTVSARFEITPGLAPREVLAVVPLLDTSLTTGAVELPYAFTLPEGTAYARLEYTASGHGGGAVTRPACIGPADEFCRRKHTLRADGVALVSDQELWRTDCKALCTRVTGGPFGSYCKENPCGAPQSVRAPRANWCPGSVTTGLVLEPEAFATPGPHTLGITIDTIAEGGSWNVAATVLAYAARP